MVVLSMTRFRLKSMWLLPKFMLANEAAVTQLRAADGFIEGKILADLPRDLWTCVMWASDADMKAYVTSGAHRALMPKLSSFACEGVTTHMPYDLLDLPSWTFVHQKLTAIGSFTSALDAPSQDHLAHVIAAPKSTLLTRPIKPRK
jgi:hypothetical protein